MCSSLSHFILVLTGRILAAGIAIEASFTVASFTAAFMVTFVVASLVDLVPSWVKVERPLQVKPSWVKQP